MRTHVDIHKINVLSICSGGAGLDLGFRLAVPGSRTICWVEWEAFAASELLRRMETGELDEAPCFTDLRSFDGEPWRGVVDCVIAGFPCQPHSVAGKRSGRDDERDLWPDVSRVIGEVRPSIVCLENVPGILTIHGSEFIGAVCADLERMGFEVAVSLVSASEVGASHKRERVFILGVANTEKPGRERTESKGRRCTDGRTAEHGGEFPLFPPGPGDLERWREILVEFPELAPAQTIADLRDVDDGLATDRTRLLRLGGNGVVPLQAAYAFRWLWMALRGERMGGQDAR